MTPTIPARDWELTCHECDGSGHVYVKHQVAERKTDIQEFKEECEYCEGRGFVFAFQDIPGIEEYVKACRPAPAAAGVSTVETHPVAWMDPTTQDVISAERKSSWLNEYGAGGAAKAATYTRALGDLRPAPAAGDALDAARYRWLCDKFGITKLPCAIERIIEGSYVPDGKKAIDAAIDAELAAQRKG
ncbi:DnaJ-like cysteine-rich domain-containing protein, partial [Achromobacter xylosoxidans]